MPDTLYIPLNTTGRYQTIVIEAPEGQDIVTTDLETILLDTEGKIIVHINKEE